MVYQEAQLRQETRQAATSPLCQQSITRKRTYAEDARRGGDVRDQDGRGVGDRDARGEDERGVGDRDGRGEDAREAGSKLEAALFFALSAALRSSITEARSLSRARTRLFCLFTRDRARASPAAAAATSSSRGESRGGGSARIASTLFFTILSTAVE